MTVQMETKSLALPPPWVWDKRRREWRAKLTEPYGARRYVTIETDDGAFYLTSKSGWVSRYNSLDTVLAQANEQGLRA